MYVCVRNSKGRQTILSVLPYANCRQLFFCRMQNNRLYVLLQSNVIAFWSLFILTRICFCCISINWLHLSDWLLGLLPFVAFNELAIPLSVNILLAANRHAYHQRKSAIQFHICQTLLEARECHCAANSAK